MIYLVGPGDERAIDFFRTAFTDPKIAYRWGTKMWESCRIQEVDLDRLEDVSLATLESGPYEVTAQFKRDYADSYALPIGFTYQAALAEEEYDPKDFYGDCVPNYDYPVELNWERPYHFPFRRELTILVDADNAEDARERVMPFLEEQMNVLCLVEITDLKEKVEQRLAMLNQGVG